MGKAKLVTRLFDAGMDIKQVFRSQSGLYWPKYLQLLSKNKIPKALQL